MSPFATSCALLSKGDKHNSSLSNCMPDYISVMHRNQDFLHSFQIPTALRCSVMGCYRAGVYSRRKLCYNISTKARAFYGKGFVCVPRQYYNINPFPLEPQRLFGFASFDLHHFCTICFFEVWIDSSFLSEILNLRLHFCRNAGAVFSLWQVRQI